MTVLNINESYLGRGGRTNTAPTPPSQKNKRYGERRRGGKNKDVRRNEVEPHTTSLDPFLLSSRVDFY